MSLSNLLQENSYELYARSMHSSTPIDAPTESFRYSLLGGSNLGVTGGYNYAGTFLVNYGPPSADTTNIANANFNQTTGIFTIPTSGVWNMTAGVLYANFSGIIGNTGGATILVGIAPPGDTSNVYGLTEEYVTQNIIRNWSINTNIIQHFSAGEQLQAYTQQGFIGNQVTIDQAVGGYYAFFSGFLVQPD